MKKLFKIKISYDGVKLCDSYFESEKALEETFKKVRLKFK